MQCRIIPGESPTVAGDNPHGLVEADVEFLGVCTAAPRRRGVFSSAINQGEGAGSQGGGTCSP